MPKKDSKKKMKVFKPDTNNLLVKIIEDKTEQLSIALGITDDNAIRLQRAGEDALRKTKTISGAMSEISKSCNHANELIWIGYVMGRNMGERIAGLAGSAGSVGSMNLGSFIEDLLRKKRGDKGTGPNPDGKD